MPRSKHLRGELLEESELMKGEVEPAIAVGRLGELSCLRKHELAVCGEARQHALLEEVDFFHRQTKVAVLPPELTCVGIGRCACHQQEGEPHLHLPLAHMRLH